jgi:hypothetical protein
MTNRRLGAFLVVALLVLSVAGPSEATSVARRWSPLGVSRLGHHWHESLEKPLFGPQLRLSPGRPVKRTFYVRNQSGEPARLRIRLRVTDAHGSLRPDVINVAAHMHPGRWKRARHPGSTRVVLRTIRKGAVVPVTVRVRIRPRSGNSSMDRSLHLQVKVRLTKKIR